MLKRGEYFKLNKIFISRIFYYEIYLRLKKNAYWDFVIMVLYSTCYYIRWQLKIGCVRLKEKWSFRSKKSYLCDLIKCLKPIKLQRWLLTCAPISESPFHTSTIIHNILEYKKSISNNMLYGLHWFMFTLWDKAILTIPVKSNTFFNHFTLSGVCTWFA